jgi:galactokinase
VLTSDIVWRRYVISGPELETMCDIVRSVPGVLGERMLGGGDKGASGCIALSEAASSVATAVDVSYPRSRPDYAEKYATHVVNMCQGVTAFEGVL